ncbi:MAG: hypothetical protein SFW63_02805 [Alphaproteobacteria bacterium]|nr:hypothetical protein [Alphaproteobacteria bacterium]
MAPAERLARFFSAPPSWRWLVLLLAGLLAAMFLRAWVAEDAYITFRVIDNAVSGHGLRWNLHERVQVYTHPLWLLLNIPVHALWGNLFHSAVAVSLLCSLLAVAVVLATRRAPMMMVLALLLVPFMASKSVMDYTSSGLETALAYLLFALVGFVLVRLHEHRYFWFFLSLGVALSLLNRLDTAILYAPVLLWLVITQRAQVRWLQVVYGALPLIAWFYFALLYYGFVFPNTKYAKLDTGLPLALYLQQSANYVKYLLVLDLAGFVVLCSSLWFIFGTRAVAQMIAVGIYCYFLYVLRIGGDYMAGRFWALPIFATIWLWYVYPPQRLRADHLFAIAALLIAAYVVSPMLRNIHENCRDCIELKGRIIDSTRSFRANSLIKQRWPLEIRQSSSHGFCRDGRRRLAKKNPPVEVMFFVGMHAYCAGPQLRAIDMLGLGDALLARLPASDDQRFYIGHFRREIPKGYAYAVETGFTTLMHPSLARYYEKLRLITQGELFDTERLKTIVQFNLGAYDHWKDEYLNETK